MIIVPKQRYEARKVSRLWRRKVEYPYEDQVAAFFWLFSAQATVKIFKGNK